MASAAQALEYFLEALPREKRDEVVKAVNERTRTAYSLLNVRLLAGNSNPQLAKKIAEALGIEVYDCKATTFSNSETRIKPSEEESATFRGRDIFIVQTGCAYNGLSVNDHLMELQLMMDACRRGQCRSMTLIVPCYFYARQDKKDASRAPISAEVVATNLISCGLDRIICFDLHNPGIQGFFKNSCDNLFPTKLQRKWLEENIFNQFEDYRENVVIISPDAGGSRKVEAVAKILKCSHNVMSKTRDYRRENYVERITLLVDIRDIGTAPEEFFKGKTCIIFDDIIDTAGTAVAAINTLKEFGAQKIGLVGTHAPFSGPAIDRINACDNLDFVLVTDTIPQNENLKRCPKLNVVSVADMLAEVILKIRSDKSLKTFFSF